VEAVTQARVGVTERTRTHLATSRRPTKSKSHKHPGSRLLRKSRNRHSFRMANPCLKDNHNRPQQHTRGIPPSHNQSSLRHI
jgi:hypothetical protein